MFLLLLLCLGGCNFVKLKTFTFAEDGGDYLASLDARAARFQAIRLFVVFGFGLRYQVGWTTHSRVAGISQQRDCAIKGSTLSLVEAQESSHGVGEVC